MTATIILQMLDRPACIPYVFLELSGLLVNIKSMNVGLSVFLKHVGSFIKFHNL